MTDMVVIGELKTKVIFLDDIHLIMNLLQQFLTGGLFLNKKFGYQRKSSIVNDEKVVGQFASLCPGCARVRPDIVQ